MKMEDVKIVEHYRQRSTTGKWNEEEELLVVHHPLCSVALNFVHNNYDPQPTYLYSFDGNHTFLF
jgi:hypothetical protein